MAHPLIDNAEPEDHKYDYDLVVIGGGSGGLACSKEAAKFGKKVAVLDFVKPTPIGTTWGLGGTCVNVGCIPKKLMHNASLLGESIEDAKHYGWDVEKTGMKHDWEKMVGAVQDHIGSLNWGYRTALRDKGVTYLNAFAKFVDPHTLECVNRAKQVSKITARRFVLATGGRPKYLGLPNEKELCITSDDIFSRSTPPGKTLVVGASYVSLECAGFLAGLGYDVTVMARSIFLRGFDQQMANAIVEYMGSHGTKFVQGCVPASFNREGENQVKVTWKKTDGTTDSGVFDTVLLAIGRTPETHDIGLDKAGVVVDPATGKLDVVNERTNVPHIYAIGDIVKGGLELTPVAIKAGRLLARRLYNKSTLLMNYLHVPTTIFTPIEYGCVGLAEEDAIAKLGEKNVEVYHSYYRPLEWTIAEREENACYVKLICNKLDNERVIGLHVVGIHAGEITQGFATAIVCGATKAHFDMTVGIHPTSAEEFTTLDITKSSGLVVKSRGC